MNTGRMMPRRLRALNGGRARVWWIHHGQDAIRSLQLVTVVAIWLLVGHFSYQDELDAERSAHRHVAEQLRQEKLARGLPRTVFVIEAANPAAAQLTLATIGSDADSMRDDLRRRK